MQPIDPNRPSEWLPQQQVPHVLLVCQNPRKPPAFAEVDQLFNLVLVELYKLRRVVAGSGALEDEGRKVVERTGLLGL